MVAVPAGAYCGRPLVPDPSVEATMPRSGVSCTQHLRFLCCMSMHLMIALHAANGTGGSGSLSYSRHPVNVLDNAARYCASQVLDSGCSAIMRRHAEDMIEVSALHRKAVLHIGSNSARQLTLCNEQTVRMGFRTRIHVAQSKLA